ncbi:MAG TPA: NTP transferase domain-containing protein [Candidatus Peribacterales bacterium]|nr:NTP transferase domain-containing protein [Candidatus Peribacterales bacterium]
MQTLLLLAGRSRRFAPLKEKALWPFLGEPLLSHQLKRMKEGGIENITFVGGHHNLEEVHTLFPKIPSIEQEDLELGMRGALLSALKELKGGPVCIVSSNDVIEPAGYRRLVEASKKDGVEGALLAQRVKRYFPGGYLMNSPGEEKKEFPRIAGIVEKPGEGKEPSDLVNIVAHIHNHPEKLLDILEDASSTRDDAYEVALTKLCKELNYVAVPYEEEWSSVKYPWHILDLTERFLSEIKVGSGSPLRPSSGSAGRAGSGSGSKADIHPSAVIEGPVILEEGVRVMPHATIQGPCYIGRGTIIGNNCLIRNSIIGEQCVIGYSSEIARSNLHSHVWTHSTYLGDSVIGRNVAFGAGSVIANFRLDEGEISSMVQEETLNTQRKKLGVMIGNDVRVGIHTSFAPGVKIGEGSFISTATYVSRDVSEGKYVHTHEGVLEERENKTGVPGIRST